MSDWNKKIIEEFRANEGRVGGNFANMTLLLLHTTGAKSGRPRLNPVAYTKDKDRLVIIASKGGAESHPDWYYNVLANPNVTVEVGSEKYEAIATVEEEPERTRLYDQMAAQYPGFEAYRQKTSRVIPVITLKRKG
ncbi:MAG: nitroreductase family deazaflavin-dependent oxidoreductase [Ardenticatenaceae bacterium]|mgnify:CR=1 FL=1|nr:nitroreductase family deazaflavin-dependent oxidoreductase [Ardenticatenaceae bacterium]